MMSWLGQHFTPMWIVWGVELGLIVVVLGLALRQRLRGDSLRDAIGLSGVTLLAIVIFTSSLLIAPLATAFSSPTLTDWWQMAAVRIAWQLGGALVLASALVWEARASGKLGDRRIWLACVVLIAVGGALCSNSLRDLADGPLELHGVPAFAAERTPSGRGGGVFATLVLHAPDGTSREVDLRGWAATVAEDRLAACRNSTAIAVTILRHVDAVLDVTCE